MRHPWSGVVAIENQITGDGRVFVDGCFRWEEADLAAEVLSFRWDREDDGAHMGAVEVGRITSLERQANGRIFGRGWIDDEWEHGADFLTVLQAGPHGVSMDGDDYVVQVLDTTIQESDEAAPQEALAMVAAAGDPDPGEDAGVVVFQTAAGDILERWLEVRIRAVTACDIPAFNECVITLDDATTETDEPDDEADQPTDDAAAASTATPAVAANVEGACCEECAARAARRSGHGTSDRAVAAAAAALVASTGDRVEGIPLEPPPGWYRRDAARVAAYQTAAGTIRVTTSGDDAGRVEGYVAPWGLCHTGYHGECVLTPRSASRYGYFQTGYVVLQDGTEVATGPLTLGAGHADLSLSMRAALAHYDDVSTAVADIVCEEDEHGIWFGGALRPGVTHEQVRALRASGPSGDWRPAGLDLEMIAAHVVNAQGWPYVKARVASGRVQALVAGGGRGSTLRPADPLEERLSALEAMVRADGLARLARHEGRVRARALARLTR